MLRAIENIGVEMSLGLRFYARNELSGVSCGENEDDSQDDYIKDGDDDPSIHVSVVAVPFCPGELCQVHRASKTLN